MKNIPLRKKTVCIFFKPKECSPHHKKRRRRDVFCSLPVARGLSVAVRCPRADPGSSDVCLVPPDGCDGPGLVFPLFRVVRRWVIQRLVVHGRIDFDGPVGSDWFRVRRAALGLRHLGADHRRGGDRPPRLECEQDPREHGGSCDTGQCVGTAGSVAHGRVYGRTRVVLQRD